MKITLWVRKKSGREGIFSSRLIISDKGDKDIVDCFEKDVVDWAIK